jgi:cob(I)alamin adenosyltransferase
VVTLNRIYTRTGDKGSTALASGERRSKADLRVETYGTVDETNACIGLVRLHAEPALDAMLGAIQNDLFDLGADLAPLKSFVLPGGSAASAALHLARTICRRAERLAVALAATEGEVVSAEALQYLNRLSDFLFVASRTANGNGADDVLWVPGKNR